MAPMLPALALLGMLGMVLLLVVGCSVSGTGGSTGSTGGSGGPPVAQSTPPPPPASTGQLPPGPLLPTAGAPAIAPHPGAVPSFSADEMAAYARTYPLGFPSAGAGAGTIVITIVKNEFLTSDALHHELNLPGGLLGQSASQASGIRAAMSQSASAPANPASARLVGLVVLRGTFVFEPGAPSEKSSTDPYAYEVFDATSGNLLMWGGLTQPPTVPAATPTTQPTPVTHPPTPTNTPAPQCSSLLGGTGTMNVDKVYLDVEAGGGATNPGNLPTGADVHWVTSPTPGVMQPVGGAQIADKGTIGAGGFTNLTCAQIKGASYGGGSVAVADGEVFLVKTAGGHYAKVLISVIPGTLGPALRWQTYS
jgi:hypothetical protein